MKNIPSDVGDATDCTMCAYAGYFPKIDCILCICDKCGTSKYKAFILEKDARKICYKSKCFPVKLWVPKQSTKKMAMLSLSYIENVSDVTMKN